MSDARVHAHGGRLQMPRSRGAASGFLLILLGVWGALIPFVGPRFDFAFTPDQEWIWTNARGWLEVATRRRHGARRPAVARLGQSRDGDVRRLADGARRRVVCRRPRGGRTVGHRRRGRAGGVNRNQAGVVGADVLLRARRADHFLRRRRAGSAVRSYRARYRLCAAPGRRGGSTTTGAF